eukprot:12338332-Ditylum_brightwellii.AAC.1
MFAYLNAHKFYIDFNTFEIEEEGSLDFVTGLHPKLTNTDNLCVILQEENKEVEFEEDTTKDNRKGEEVFQELTEFAQKYYPDNNKDQLMMPKFKLQMRMCKYGNVRRRVESPFIVIKCVLKDAPYLKTMLTYGYEMGQIQVGEFVLSGIHLFADVD